ncbi:MAG: 16S rRNA (guanine(527)-N(7))-methyltransferase RsmG [Bacteroidota bacterium]
MQTILSHFPDVTDQQRAQFAQLDALYRDWNQKINVISRKDIENLYTRHVLHSLAIAKMIRFAPGTRVLDLGTGGGFPGIPLAILFPESEFVLIDGIRKKVKVVEEVATALELKNVSALQQRAEERKGGAQFDFIVTRAVALLEKLVPWSQRLVHQQHKNALPNGLIALKGGRVKEEVAALPKGTYTELYPIQDFFDDAFFAEKSVVYVQY